jgi:hypothetical protein
MNKAGQLTTASLQFWEEPTATTIYSISYSDTAGSLTHLPTADITSNNNLINVGITGCSIQGADRINGQLNANAAGGDRAYVTADIKGPGASVTTYDLFGYVVPNLAWAGQYADSIKGTSITLDAYGNNDKNPYINGQNSKIYYAWAESKLVTKDALSPVYTVNNWYQDSMAGGSSYSPGIYPKKWAMSNVYMGTAAVDGTDVNDRIDITTAGYYSDQIGSPYPIQTYGGDWVTPVNSIRINSQSMGYDDSIISYSNVDGVTPSRGIYSYGYVNLDKGINTHDTIYY